jgi:hypothetical protein
MKSSDTSIHPFIHCRSWPQNFASRLTDPMCEWHWSVMYAFDGWVCLHTRMSCYGGFLNLRSLKAIDGRKVKNSKGFRV